MVSELTKKGVSKEAKKIEQLEIVVHALVRKVLSLETDIKELKQNSEGYEEQILYI